MQTQEGKNPLLSSLGFVIMEPDEVKTIWCGRAHVAGFVFRIFMAEARGYSGAAHANNRGRSSVTLRVMLLMLPSAPIVSEPMPTVNSAAHHRSVALAKVTLRNCQTVLHSLKVVGEGANSTARASVVSAQVRSVLIP